MPGNKYLIAQQHCLIHTNKRLQIIANTPTLNPLPPHISMHFLHTALCIYYGADKENLFNDQEPI